MSLLPIDPLAAMPAVSEWQVPGLDGTVPAAGARGPAGVAETGGVAGVESAARDESFGAELGRQIERLAELQVRAAEASRSLAEGTAADVTEVVLAVEKAQLAMQLAGQIRTRAAEAINTIFHTQV